jgi:hypothetical protein
MTNGPFAAHTKTSFVTKVVARNGTAISVGAFAAVLLTGLMMVTSSPVTAQSAKQKEALLKFQKSRDEPPCKVSAAGYIFPLTNEVFVEASCPGKQEPVLATSPKGRDQGILEVALAAMSTGKQVHMRADDNGTLLWLIIANPK